MKFEHLIRFLRATTRPSEKREIIQEHDCEELRYILNAAYEPFTLFNVKIVLKDIPVPGQEDLFDLFEEAKIILRFCVNSKSPKQNKEAVIPFLKKLNAGSQDLFVGTLNKNWKAGISSKTVVKLFPGLIKQFDVQLANTFKRNYDKHKLEQYIVSYKLDGLRCIALRESSDENYDKGKWTLYSRKGKEFLTVDHIKPQLEVLYERHGWSFFDGELYKHGLPFEEIQGPLMAFTRGQVSDMEYHVFVAGQADKFLSGQDPNHVEPIAGPTEKDAPDIHYVNIGTITYDKIEETLEEAFEKGYEGIMLRDPEKLYDYKRSNALLKLKSSADESEGEVISDCIVESIEYNDQFPVIEDGEVLTKRLLNKIWVIQENGIRCKVGSGYDLNFRYTYTENPNKLIGKIVEIKHQGWGANGRMRFPRLYRVREDL